MPDKILGDVIVAKEFPDLEDGKLFNELRSVPAEPNKLAERREAQTAFDAVLSKLGTRAVAPRADESDREYLAILATQAAQFGPEERRKIDRLSLPSAALAEVARQDLEFARREIETPNHSLRDGEVREVTKIDRSGRPIIEFFTKQGPDFWMRDFKPPIVQLVSGGSNGIATEDRGGMYRFDKSHLPEVAELRRQEAYRDSTEFRIIDAYVKAGLEPPNVAELLKKGG